MHRTSTSSRRFSPSFVSALVAVTLLVSTNAFAMQPGELITSARANVDAAKKSLVMAHDPKSAVGANGGMTFSDAVSRAGNAVQDATQAAKQGAAKSDTDAIVADAQAVQKQAIDQYFVYIDGAAADLQKAGNRDELENKLDRLAGTLFMQKKSSDPRLQPLVAKYKCTFFNTTGPEAFHGVHCPK